MPIIHENFISLNYFNPISTKEYLLSNIKPSIKKIDEIRLMEQIEDVILQNGSLDDYLQCCMADQKRYLE